MWNRRMPVILSKHIRTMESFITHAKIEVQQVSGKGVLA